MKKNYFAIKKVIQRTSLGLCMGLPSLMAQCSPLLYSHTPRRPFPEPLITIVVSELEELCDIFLAYISIHRVRVLFVRGNQLFYPALLSAFKRGSTELPVSSPNELTVVHIYIGTCVHRNLIKRSAIIY